MKPKQAFNHAEKVPIKFRSVYIYARTASKACLQCKNKDLKRQGCPLLLSPVCVERNMNRLSTYRCDCFIPREE